MRDEREGEAEERITHGVKTLRGDPKKAILKLSGPMIIGMSFQTIYNLVDAVWVSGLGADALSAVGLFFPFMMLLMGFSNGVSIGGGSAVSRRIGERNKTAADNTTVHTLLLAMLTAFTVSLPFLPFLNRIYHSMGARESVIRMAEPYSRIVFSGSIFIFFTNMGNSILRAEGDARRSMVAIILGSVLNIILDPIFIYILKLGVIGAAWATVISMSLTSIIIFYWLFVKKDTYVDFSRKSFSFDWKIVGEILRVGLPASLSLISMAVAMYLVNMIIIRAAGTRSIAVFTSGWRIVSLGTIPLMGIATGVTAVTAAAYGERNIDKLNTAYTYAIKIGTLIELSIGILSFIFAKQISKIFTYSKNTRVIADELIMFLRWMAPLYPFIPLGMLTSAMFQGIGKGERAFIVTFLRTVVFQVILSYVFGITLNIGLKGIVWGILTGNFIAVTISYLWGKNTIKKLYSKNYFDGFLSKN